jgi:hypothetical protein
MKPLGERVKSTISFGFAATTFKPYDIIFLDIHMPVLDGYQVNNFNFDNFFQLDSKEAPRYAFQRPHRPLRFLSCSPLSDIRESISKQEDRAKETKHGILFEGDWANRQAP